MKKIAIISWYDSGYWWSVFLDGHLIDKDNLEESFRLAPRDSRRKYLPFVKELIDTYRESQTKALDLLLKNGYDFIAICEDGSTSVWEVNEK